MDQTQNVGFACLSVIMFVYRSDQMDVRKFMYGRSIGIMDYERALAFFLDRTKTCNV